MRGQFCTRSHTIAVRKPWSSAREPAVARQAHLQERFRKVAADCRRCADDRRCRRGSGTTGGLRPPLLFARVRPPTTLRLLRCTNEQSAPGTAGVSPPWDGKRTCKGATGTVRKTVARRVGARRCGCVSVTHGGYAPRSCSRKFARRRNYDFCDAHTNNQRQERPVSVRRGTRSAFASELRIRSQTDITRARSGEREPAVVWESLMPGQF